MPNPKGRRVPIKWTRPDWTREELAWAAGFMEGEGSFRLNLNYSSDSAKRNPYTSTSIDAVQVNREPLARLHSIFPFGKVYGPYRHKGGKKVHYRFIVHSFEGAQAMIAALWPWLSNKRRAQAKRALSRSKH